MPISEWDGFLIERTGVTASRQKIIQAYVEYSVGLEGKFVKC
jgi:hypothetical protein